MKSIALICLIGLIGTISCASAPFGVSLASLCNTDPTKSGYIFESLDSNSSIAVTNEGAIACDIEVKVLAANADNYEVTMYFDTFTYDCDQFATVNDQLTCKGIGPGKQQYKAQLVDSASSPVFKSFVLSLPKVAGDAAKGKLAAYVTLVSKQDKDGKCQGSASEDTLFKCADKTCIYGDFKCNGVFNCNDASDQTDALCKAKEGGLGWFSWLLIIVAIAVVLGGGGYVAYVKFLN
ncbi:hypothetical protein HDE_08846 [Halotydeus destructor]|nr:hypothetical protein HDE_08846 [Halotydeus destructor]